MTWQTILLSIVIVLACGFLMLCCAGLAYWSWKLYRLLAGLRIDQCVETLTLLKSLIEKYQEGTAKIASSQVDAIVSLEAEISRFRDLMFSGDRSGMQEYDADKASTEYEVQQLIRQHRIPRDEAEARAKERDVYSKLAEGVRS